MAATVMPGSGNTLLQPENGWLYVVEYATDRAKARVLRIQHPVSPCADCQPVDQSMTAHLTSLAGQLDQRHQPVDHPTDGRLSPPDSDIRYCLEGPVKMNSLGLCTGPHVVNWPLLLTAFRTAFQGIMHELELCALAPVAFPNELG